MKRDARIKRIMIVLIVVFTILIIASLTFYNVTGMTIDVLSEEKGVFEIMGGQVTQEYILVGVKNIGTEEYLIDEINITNCGKVAGENITPDNGIKIFSIQCENQLEKDTEIKEEMTIFYSSETLNNQTQKMIILGNVSSKKCFYEISGEQIPIIVNDCVDRTDCEQLVFTARDYINEDRRANNQSEINSNNISVLDCSYE